VVSIFWVLRFGYVISLQLLSEKRRSEAGSPVIGFCVSARVPVSASWWQQQSVAHFDIKGILRAFYTKKVLKEEEIRDLVKNIEDKDNTRIKHFKEVFG